MCFPGAPLALAAAQGMASFMGQQSQYAMQETQYQQNLANALSDNRILEGRLNAQQMEEGKAYAQKDNLALIDEAKKEASVRAAAATGGVAGNTVTDLVNGVGSEVNLQRSTLNDNWMAEVTQTQSEKVSGVAQAASRIGEVAQPIAPNPAGTILGVAAAGINYGGTPGGKSFFDSLAPSGGSNASGSGLNINTMNASGTSVGGA